MRASALQPIDHWSFDPLRELAQAYDVELRAVDLSGFSDAGRIPSVAPSPALGLMCDTENRIVWVHAIHHFGVEHLLHEICHVITQPPTMHIEATPENFCLLQFEREVGRELLTRAQFRDVCSWQRGTGCHDGMDLDLPPRWWQHNRWTLGYKVCERLGLLTPQRRMTWQMPSWRGDWADLLYEWWDQRVVDYCDSCTYDTDGRCLCDCYACEKH